jgi:O-antigen/teichoic acid export membrane protein
MTASDEDVAGGPTAKESSRALSMFGRFGWGLGDQLLSSVTNFVLGLVVARSVGPQDLGAFSIAFATYTLSLGATRAIAGELLVVRYSAVSEEDWRYGVKRAAGTAAMTGVVVGAGCLVASAVVQGSLGIVLSVVGIFLPSLLLQDAWRYSLFARGKGGSAFLNDLVWAVVMFVAFVLLRTTDRSSVGWFTLAWAGAGCVAAAVGLVQLRTLPSGPRASVRWLRLHRDLAPRFLAEFTLASGISSLTLFAMGSVMGLAQLGHLRAGQIALGPLNVLFAGAGLVATPEGVRLLRESPRRLLFGCRWISVVMASGVLAWAVIVSSLPRSVGEFVLGTNWEGARALLLPLSIGAVGFGLSFGAWAGLRSLAAAKRSLRARWIDSIATMLLGLSGAAIGGALGAAWGFAAAGFILIANAWWQFSRALSEYEANVQTEAAVDASG